VVCSDHHLAGRIADVVKARTGNASAPPSLTTADDALEFLNLELPELVFVNFSDPAIDSFALLNDILKDPWLHFGGIIAACADQETSDRLEKVRGGNIIVTLIADELERYLPKILDIVGRNRRILLQRGIGSDLMQTLSGSYRLDNDTLEATCYANLVCNFLFNTNRIDAGGRMGVNLALTEMLINAIEHGNCGITYEEKNAWLEEGNTMRSLIVARCRDPQVAARRVLFEYTIAPERSTFLVADEGEGFDWRHVADGREEDALQRLHGRGITLTRQYTQNLRYTEKGNAVTFEIEHLRDCTNMVPAVFEDRPPIHVNPGDIVLEEGAAGDFLYYIAKGHFDVIVRGDVVMTMSADDIVMGEMAFLLNSRRTATVKATGPGTLIRLSKKEFVEAIKKKPHYGLFLSRLLAQRIERLNAARC
jgi:hypothetical protein